MKKSFWLSVAVVAFSSLTPQASANSYVANGSFETATATITTTFQYAGVSDWTDTGLGEALVLNWAPGNYLFPGVGLAGAFPLSPDGGNFAISDGDFLTSPITQTINGLTPGSSYALSFYQGLAQDTEGITPPGAVTGYWQVSLGAATQNSAMMYADGSIPTYSPWTQQSMTFTAASASEVLSFFAVGTGVPPILALDGVSLVDAAPEPASLFLMFAGVGYLAWRLRARRASASASHR